MPPRLPQASSRYYPKFSRDVSYELQHDARLTWDALYNLRSQTHDVNEITLHKDTKISTELFPRRPLILIIIQDSVGGWKVTWADKFKGASGITLITCPNTYSSFLWWAKNKDTAYLIGGFTGGVLLSNFTAPAVGGVL